MDCCGHALTHRNWMSGTMLTSVGAMLAGGIEPSGSTLAAKTAETASAALGLSAEIHLGRRPYAWREDRNYVKGAPE